MKIVFIADKVSVQTGRVDSSAKVVFEVGEYALNDIKELVTITKKNLKITVEEYDENKLVSS